MPENTKSSILIIDDEQEHAQVMCEALQRIGHKCDVTYNLAEAQARLNRKNYDVIVTDLMMDGRRDGLEVLRRAKTMNPPPPVLLVTAINDVPTSKQAMQEGAYDYIVKPLDLEDFRTQVNRAAERAALLETKPGVGRATAWNPLPLLKESSAPAGSCSRWCRPPGRSPTAISPC